MRLRIRDWDVAVFQPRTLTDCTGKCVNSLGFLYPIYPPITPLKGPHHLGPWTLRLLRLYWKMCEISGCFVCAVKIALNLGELKVLWMERGDALDFLPPDFRAYADKVRMDKQKLQTSEPTWQHDVEFSQDLTLETRRPRPLADALVSTPARMQQHAALPANGCDEG